MDLIFGVLIVIGLTIAAKSAIDRTKDGYRKSRDARVKEAAKAYPKGSLPKSQRNAVARRHAVGYWGREAAHGFPVTRTGWHVGRAAHRKAHEQGRQARSEAETQHVEAQAARRQAVAGHRERQAEARRQIEGILTTEPNAKGKKAVRKAADAVVLPFPDRPAPPLPADVGKPEPGPYAPKPDEKPTRRVDGQPETEADKRAFDERESGYDGPLNRDGRRPDMSDPQEAEAVAALDGMRQRAENEPGADAATWSPQTAPLATPSPASNGNGAGPMARGTAEVTYDETIAEARRIADEAEQHVAELRTARISNMVEQLATVLNDPGSLAALSEVDEALKQEMKAAQEVHDRATAFRDQHQREHGGMAQAHQDAPVAGAEPEYYEG